MRGNLNNILARAAQGMSISRYLILGLILVVFITVTLGGFIGIRTIWLQLGQQLCSHVQDAQIATGAFYRLEREYLGNLTDQIAQNSTLNTLVQNRDIESLAAHLDDLKQSANIDGLIVVTSDQQRVGYVPVELPSYKDLLLNQELPFSDFITIGDQPQVIVIATSEIKPSNNSSAKALGWLIAERVLNDEFMHT
jgi:hypothetical protein